MSRKIKIITIAQDLNPDYLGGAESHHVEVVRYLAETGKYEIHLFVGLNDNLKKVLTHPAITIHPVKYPQITNLYSLSYLLFATPEIIKFAGKYRPDLIFAKEVFPLGVIGAIVKQFIHRPLYITAQNPVNYREEMVVSGPAASVLKTLAFPVFDLMLKLSLPQADTVGAISNYSAKLAKDFGAKHVIITPNAVDPKITAIGLLPHKSDKYFHILSTSKMIPRNGLDLLLAALVIIDDPKIRLHLTSNGPEETKLKQYIKDHDLDKQVIFHGLVKSKDLIGLYQQADIFVRPSRAEGLGTSFLEAMAYGVPIVATPVGGIPDFLTDHQTGLMAKTENPESVAGQIKTLMANPALREKLRTNGRRVIEEKYTWDRIGGTVDREFLKLYQQILCLLLLNSKRKVQKSKL